MVNQLDIFDCRRDDIYYFSDIELITTEQINSSSCYKPIKMSPVME